MRVKVEFITGNTLLINFRSNKTNELVRWEDLSTEDQRAIVTGLKQKATFFERLIKQDDDN